MRGSQGLSDPELGPGSGVLGRAQVVQGDWLPGVRPQAPQNLQHLCCSLLGWRPRSGLSGGLLRKTQEGPGSPLCLRGWLPLRALGRSRSWGPPALLWKAGTNHLPGSCPQCFWNLVPHSAQPWATWASGDLSSTPRGGRTWSSGLEGVGQAPVTPALLPVGERREQLPDSAAEGQGAGVSWVLGHRGCWRSG